MKKYTVYLFKCTTCIRGWVEYLKPSYPIRATITVEVEAETGQKAKNKAVTLANKGFHGLKILSVNYNDSLWGINNFPELITVINEALEKNIPPDSCYQPG